MTERQGAEPSPAGSVDTVDNQPRYTSARLLLEVRKAKAAARLELLEELLVKAQGQKAYFDEKQHQFPVFEDFLDEDGNYTPPADMGPLLQGREANGRYSEADWWLGTISGLIRTHAVEPREPAPATESLIHRLIENTFSWALEDANYLNPKHMDRIFHATLEGMKPEQAAVWRADAPEIAAGRLTELEARLAKARKDGLVHVTGSVNTQGDEVATSGEVDHVAVMNNLLRIRETNPQPTFSTE